MAPQPVTDEPQFLYLTTTGRRSGRPREIEIWCTRQRGRYSLVAEHGEAARWVRNLRARAGGTVRVGDEAFRGRACVVDAETAPELVRAVRAASEAKYGWGEGLVVEILPEAEGP